MRYNLNPTTLFIRGSFRAASTGIFGGIRSVSTLISHSVPEGRGHENTEKELGFVAAAAGTADDFFGILTLVPVTCLCVLQYDFITIFITANVHKASDSGNGQIAIIAYSAEGFEDSALLETILVATEAKAEALLAAGTGVTGTPADAVIAACEGGSGHPSAGRATEAGRRVREAVLRGIPEALKRSGDALHYDRPAYFIFSRFKGEHWVEWTPENCQYYPCHFPGQRCDFCYCPFYPCRDETLGQWVESSGGGKVWNCARCMLLHEPAVADYAKKYPGASLRELKQMRDTLPAKKEI